jgi:hypothetical protein
MHAPPASPVPQTPSPAADQRCRPVLAIGRHARATSGRLRGCPAAMSISFCAPPRGRTWTREDREEERRRRPTLAPPVIIIGNIFYELRIHQRPEKEKNMTVGPTIRSPFFRVSQLACRGPCGLRGPLGLAPSARVPRPGKEARACFFQENGFVN